MTADALLSFLTQALFFVVFVLVLVRTARRPSTANVDAALFFGDLGVIVAYQWVSEAVGGTPPWWAGAALAVLLMALPYLLLRLVDDFTVVPGWLLRAAEAGLILSVLALVTSRTKLPIWQTIALVGYFVGFEVYEAVQFVRAARHTGGVTRRRMQAAAAGSALLGAVILVAGLQAAAPSLMGFWQVLSRLSGLACGLAYFVGFAPPNWLRRAWQEPELRAFLSRAASLPRLPDTASIARALEDGAAASVGAPHAAIGLWDGERQALRFEPRTGPSAGGEVFVPSGQAIVGAAYARQRAVFSANAARDDPANDEIYRRANTRAMLVAPITAGAQRLGVLAVYAPRAPIFADEDLALVQLLADQAAVILESRTLIDAAARVRAREEATRLKDDFLSAAAHDLKTPLTTLVAQAQLLERRAKRQPETQAALQGIDRIVRESMRLRDLVLELLDASRVEEGRLVSVREPVDLVAVARESCRRHRERRCLLEAPAPVVGEYDEGRIAQVLDNLVENAIKYSPSPEPVTVRVYAQEDEARIEVHDRGIGIPAGDVPHIFDRFYRASNVDDRRFAGMGLGLYICHGIVTQHGGRMWVDSRPGAGSTFHVALPLQAEVDVRRPAGEPAAAGVER